MPNNLIGGPVITDEEGGGGPGNLITRVLNLSGKDVVTSTYNDALRPGEDAADLTSQARLIADGTLAVTDSDYDEPIELLHVGEKMYLRVVDPDRLLRRGGVARPRAGWSARGLRSGVRDDGAGLY